MSGSKAVKLGSRMRSDDRRLAGHSAAEQACVVEPVPSAVQAHGENYSGGETISFSHQDGCISRVAQAAAAEQGQDIELSTSYSLK